MGGQLIKPYEISVWEDKLTQNGFVENKLAVIGSDTMTGLNKVYDPVFHKKANGERTLTFSLKYHYIDSRTGEEVLNPFADLLTNERRVKLHYDGQWYEFIVKEHEESSDESTWTYSCTDAFVLELSKCGYNITFDSELNNNQGTAAELAQETIKNTDWRLGTVDNFKQYISEPLYFGSVVNLFTALNTDDNTTETISNGDIYVFYSYVKNKDGRNLQFIKQADTYTLDSNNVIIATNYRIQDDVKIEEEIISGVTYYNIVLNDTTIITLSGIENRYQANRLVYKQLNTYDPVMERTVDRYMSGDEEVYSYTDYVYTTSDVITNFITNGENFNILEDGSLQGWNPYVDFDPSITGDDTIDKLELVTKPELSATATLADLSALSEIEGFLKVRFKGVLTPDYKNAIYNSGFENNASFIKSVAKGDKFVFRWRAGQRDPQQPLYFLTTDTAVQEGKIYYIRSGEQGAYSYTKVVSPEGDPQAQGWYEKSSVSDVNCLVPYDKIRIVVAKYTQDTPNPYKYYYKHIDKNNIIVEFKTGTPQILNNYVEGGILQENYKHTDDIKVYEGKTYYIRSEQEPYTYTEVITPISEDISNYYEQFYTYVIDDVVQTPSTKYIYKTKNYTLSEDTEVVNGKTYYTKVDNEYIIVENPTGNPHTQGWYDTEYVWNGLTGKFEKLTNNNYLPYYYLVAEADRSVSNKVLQDVTEKIGIFVYTKEVVAEEVNQESHLVDTGDVQSSESDGSDDELDNDDDELGDDVEDSDESDEPDDEEEQEEVTYNFSATLTNPDRGTTITVTCHRYSSGWKNEVVATFVQGEEQTYVSERDNYPYTITYTPSTETITYTSTVKTDTYKITYDGTRITQKNAPIYVQDIQLTRFIADGDTNQPIVMGNIPVAASTSTTYYYLKPDDGMAAEDVELYTSPGALAEYYGLTEDIEALYNENSEKYLSIEASQSNCFNILQSIAETFECWVDLKVEHEDNGAIKYVNNLPEKYVNLKAYAGKDNYAGFKYGINLESIERTVNSDEIVTKLIVDQSQCDYVEDGYVSIASAPSNVSGESYILDFDYFYSQGFLNRDEVEADLLVYNSALRGVNTELKEKEKQRQQLENALNKLGSERNVYTELVDSAQEMKTEALGDFENLTGRTYDEYRAEHSDSTTPDEDKLTEEDTIVDIIGKLYANSAMINNYSGILTNIEQEYWQIRHQLRGLEQRLVRVWTATDGSEVLHIYVEIDDYFPGFQFTIGDDTYESTVSVKFFDISFDTPPAEAPTINFIAPSGYSMTPSSYTVDYNTVKTFKVIPNENQTGIEGRIKELREDKDELTTAFENKYRRFIQEGTWNSTDYIDSELYYLDALQASKTSAFPTVDYSINVVEISELEGFEWYLFDTGDKTYVEDTEFFGWVDKDGVRTPAREEVIVSEVEWHLEEPEQNVITVQNYKTQFEDFFQRVSATVQSVQYNDVTLPSITTVVDANGVLNPDVLGVSISGLEYTLTSNGAIIIEDDAIYIRNLTNPTNRVIINSEGIKVSSDGGDSWSTAIDGRGINAGLIYAGSLNTDEIIIGSRDNPSFRWDKSGISAFKSTNEETYDLQTYVRFDEYGLYGIQKDAGFKAKNLNEVKDNAWFAVTWDGFFIRNSYEDGGRVSITSEDDFQVIDGNDNERIKIGSWIDEDENTRAYGIRIKNASGVDTFYTDDTTGDVHISGTIEALGGNFKDLVTVGKNSEEQDQYTNPWIEIDGRHEVDGVPQKPMIKTSNYTEGAGSGWLINADGDAVFNNITARGAIKTAVFEYAEIQAVGGIFIFRPSSTIRSAAIDEETNIVYKKTIDTEIISGKTYYVYDEVDDEYDEVISPVIEDIDEYYEAIGSLVLTVDKEALFKSGQWCKISNYTNNGEAEDPELINNGLTYIYEVVRTQGSNNIILLGAAEMVDGPNKICEVGDLVGGALIDMGNKNSNASNYGIGINSSDNTVNLPRRAISLFETTIDETQDTKVTYDYQGVLGTLPEGLPMENMIRSHMVGTQGIYTKNMYIGDESQYIAFYTDKNDGNKKQLKIRANQIEFQSGDDWTDVSDPDFVSQGGHFVYRSESKIREHYVLTSDTTPVEGKAYYVIEDNRYVEIVVQSDDNPHDLGYYEKITYVSTPAGAGVITNPNDEPTNWGYNTWISTAGISLRDGEISYATLAANGLVLSKGGIEAGTPGSESDKFLYLSTENYGQTYSSLDDLLEENERATKTDWRQIIGTNFGIDSEGNIYAKGGNIGGAKINDGVLTITTGNLSIGKYITFDYIPTLTSSQPSDWTENWTNYYEKNPSYGPQADEYIHVGGTTAPTWVADTYYEKKEDNPRLIIGDKAKMAITVDINADVNSGQMTFWQNYQPVAYINNNRMTIPESVMLREMMVGQDKWSWREHDGNLQLKWIGV